MSSAFAIAAVTAVLKDLLNNGLIDHDLSAMGNVTVTALPPDRIATTSADERPQLNLFMYQVMPNIGWRNVGLPSRNATGERLTNPPLALDLHYFLTAYGAEEFHAEALLGYAMQLLHETPVLTRAAINLTLKPALPTGVTLPSGLQIPSTSDLAEQVEQIKITPLTVNGEEMSRLWTAMQAKYRPTAAYQISVVLIESTKATKAALPVLKRGKDDRGPSAQADLIPPYPTIESITLPNNQPAALLDDTLTINGHDFAGETGDKTQVTVIVRLTTPRLTQPLEITVPANERSDAQIKVKIANTAGQPPSGSYSLTVLVMPNGKPDEARTTNAALLIAPKITSGLAPVTRTSIQDNLGTATITISCVPDVLAEQPVTLVLGDREIMANPHTTQTNSLTFVAQKIPAGLFRVRLRVDGVESLLVDRSDPKQPAFDESQKITIN